MTELRVLLGQAINVTVYLNSISNGCTSRTKSNRLVDRRYSESMPCSV
jgi:hypothetical protein